MLWQAMTAAILTLAASEAGFADAGSDSPAPNTLVGVDAPVEELFQPFAPAVWFRPGAIGGRTLDEPRTWPSPLIAPPEPYRPVGFAPVVAPVFCFDGKAPVSSDKLARLDAMMSGPWAARFYVNPGWSSRTLTWSFVPDGLDIPDGGDSDLYSGPSSLFSGMDSRFGGDRAQWITLIQTCFDRWANLTGLTFVRVRYNGQEWDDGAGWDSLGASGLRGDIRIGMRNIDDASNVLAYAFFPTVVNGTSGDGGNVLFDSSENWSDSTNGYRRLRNTLMHELGHALGIKHVCPSDNTKLMEPNLSTNFFGPQHDDVRAGHTLYDDAYSPNHTAATAVNFSVLSPGGTTTIGTITGTTIANTSKVAVVGNSPDWYSFDLSVPTNVSATVTPIGTTYLDGVQLSNGDCTAGSNVNSLTQRRLSINLYGSNGSTILGSVQAPAAGQPATVTFPNMPAGRFYAVVHDSPNTSTAPGQMYTLSVSAAAATPPFNDLCANALPISTGTYTGDNGGAGTDGAAGTCGTSFGDVWYTFTPTCKGTLDVNTCGSGLDTVLSVLQGVCGTLSTLACNDNAAAGGPCGTPASALSLDVSAGLTYYIRIAGKTSTPGVYMLNLSLRTPANDLCANALTITGSRIQGSTCGGGRDAIASCAPNSGSPDVWYRYVATCNSTLRIDACNSDYDTVFSVYRGTCGALTEIACNDESPTCASGLGASWLTAPLTAGQTYYIRVSGAGGEAGAFDFTWDIIQVNDSCQTATVITPGTFSGGLCQAMRNLNNTCQAASTSPDVFYAYTPTISGLMTVSTCGSTFDTLLEVLAGPCTALTSIACNDNTSLACPGGSLTSRLAVNVTAGTTYLIRVSGRNNQAGDFTLSLIQGPANDACASAQTITGSVTGTTLNAGREYADACSFPSSSGDVWYRWVSPCPGTLSLNTCGSSYDTVLSVYLGACGGLVEGACSDNAGLAACPSNSLASSVSVPVPAGQVYYIRVSGASDAAGAFNLNLSLAPFADNCEQAAAVATGNSAFDTRCCTNDGGVPCGSSNASPDAWYRLTSTCTGTVWVDLCNANFDTVVSAFTGVCHGFTMIACNDDQGASRCPGNPTSSAAAFRATAGTTYHIRISGNAEQTGTGMMNVRCCPADFNQSFTISVQDIFDFLAAYFATNPTADVNNSGGVSVQDIFDFLAAYFAGCP